jgi:hypothetical protein
MVDRGYFNKLARSHVMRGVSACTQAQTGAAVWWQAGSAYNGVLPYITSPPPPQLPVFA